MCFFVYVFTFEIYYRLRNNGQPLYGLHNTKSLRTPGLGHKRLRTRESNASGIIKVVGHCLQLSKKSAFQ